MTLTVAAGSLIANVVLPSRSLWAIPIGSGTDPGEDVSVTIPSLEDLPKLRPLYVVAFEATPSVIPGAESWPVLPLLPGVNVGTMPHGLDRDLIEVLPALWYCLQLPRTVLDLTDWPAAGALGLSHWIGASHAILLAPADHLESAVGNVLDVEPFEPALVFCPDRLVGQIVDVVAAAGFPQPPQPISSLSHDTLAGHWKLVADAYGVPVPDDVPTTLVRRLDLAGVSIARRQLRRSLALPGGEITSPEEIADAALDLWIRRAQLHALIELGPVGPDSSTDDDADGVGAGHVPLGDDAILSHRAAARYPISLVVPGLSHRYGRRAYSPEQLAAAGVFEPYDETHLWTADPPADDETGERLAFEFAAAYQAVARDGLAVTLPMVPPKAWTALHALERHLTDTEGGKVWKVTKLLDQLDRECEPIWSEPVLDLLKGAKVVRAVSNFPIGLLTPPGFDEPLATLVPVVQQPTTPLTQTVQQALAGRHSTDLSAGARVLVAECIPMTDDVGVASLRAFQLMRDMLAESDSKVVVEVVETVSTEEVRAAIERIRPDILILSAHGYFPTDGSASGIDIGGELSLGDDLGPVPHVVLLSACSTAVRGDSGPTVVDVLRRRGARAVLGAQVPVRVDRNVMLLGRLLVNLSEVYDSDVVGADNLLDLWHHVQTSNQVNDLVSTSDNLARWAHTPRPGMMPPIMEFMSGIGVEIPIRRGHNFADTVTRLLHVADQSGDRDQVVRWLPKRFVPEAAFYHFVGEPERVMLRPPPAALLPKAFAPPT